MYSRTEIEEIDEIIAYNFNSEIALAIEDIKYEERKRNSKKIKIKQETK